MSEKNFDSTPRRAEGSSKDAGEYLAESGKTAQLKRDILRAVSMTEGIGLTVREFAQYKVSEHHGRISGAFSTLHEAGYLERLQARRSRYEIYVLPKYVDGRPTRQHASVAREMRRQDLLSKASWAKACLQDEQDPRIKNAVTDLITEIERQFK